MTQEKLNEILDKHLKWLRFEHDGEYADLRSADLTGLNMICANLAHADLSFANLSHADLTNTILVGAHMTGVDLTSADYTGTIVNLQCPEEGSFIAWKKLRDGAIAKLLIPEDAERSSATSRKCRASKAIVLAIYNTYGEEISEGTSKRDMEFIYRVGETVYPDHWDEDRWNECSNGIHFFITRREAEEYEY